MEKTLLRVSGVEGYPSREQGSQRHAHLACRAGNATLHSPHQDYCPVARVKASHNKQVIQKRKYFQLVCIFKSPGHLLPSTNLRLTDLYRIRYVLHTQYPAIPINFGLVDSFDPRKSTPFLFCKCWPRKWVAEPINWQGELFTFFLWKDFLILYRVLQFPMFCVGDEIVF